MLLLLYVSMWIKLLFKVSCVLGIHFITVMIFVISHEIVWFSRTNFSSYALLESLRWWPFKSTWLFRSFNLINVTSCIEILLLLLMRLIVIIWNIFDWHIKTLFCNWDAIIKYYWLNRSHFPRACLLGLLHYLKAFLVAAGNYFLLLLLSFLFLWSLHHI